MKQKCIRRFLAGILAGSMLLSTGMMASAAELSDLFDASYYAQKNPDVVAAVGNSEEALLQHYLNFGAAEGREGGLFDPLAYAEAYPDVKAVYGNDVQALCNHFLTNGLAEGRTKGVKFNATCYAALNPDLAAKCGKDEGALFNQYITEGKAQGRKGAHTDRVNKWYCDKKGEHTINEWIVEYYTTCVDSGVQEGYCEICGERETHVDKPDGYSHKDKNHNDRCDLCGARLNTHAH